MIAITIFFLIFALLIFSPAIANYIAYKAGYGHKWVYRNPHDRTCERCGRRECEVQDIGRNAYGEIGALVRWEEYYPLAHSPELCKPITKRQ